MSSVILARPSRPVEVLHNGAWVTGWLKTYRRDDEGWRGTVRYSPQPGARYHRARRALATRVIDSSVLTRLVPQ
jgi:hypothetical protein